MGKRFIRSLDPYAANYDLHEREKFNEQRHFMAKDPTETGGLTDVNRMQEITADVIEERTEITASTPGQILVGGDLHLADGSQLSNDKSTVIVGGTSFGAAIANVDANGTERRHYRGTYRNSIDQRRGWKGHERVDFGTNARGPFNESTKPEEIKLGVYRTQFGSAPAAGEAKTMNEEARRMLSESQQAQHARRSGFSVGLSHPALERFGALKNSLSSLSGSNNARVQAMAGSLALYNLHKGLEALPQGLAGVRGGFSFGRSEQHSRSQSRTEGLLSSQVSAVGTVAIKLSGDGSGSAPLQVVGSDIGGNERTIFAVNGPMRFAAMDYGGQQSSQNWSKSRSIGASFGLNDPNLDLGAGGGRGHYQGETRSWRLSHIGTASGHTDLGKDSPLHIDGAQIFGRSVRGLTDGIAINNPQNQGWERGSQRGLNGSISLSLGSVSGNLGGGYGKISSNYQTINSESGARATPELGGELGEALRQHNQAYNAEHAARSGQSGIFAGDDGFQIENKGEIKLGTGIITSSERAEALGRNRLVTDSISRNSVENFSHSTGFALSGSVGSQFQNGAFSPSAPIAGAALHRDHANSRTSGSIGTRNLEIRDPAKQGADSATAAQEFFAPRWSDSPGSGLNAGLQGPQQLEKLQKEAQVTGEFGQIAPRAVADWAEKQGRIRTHERNLQIVAIEEKLLAMSKDPTQQQRLRANIAKRRQEISANQANYDLWKEGGSGRNLLHGGIGALASGNMVGAATGYITSALAPTLNQLNNPLLKGFGGAAVGAIVGSGNPVAMAVGANSDWNNRQLHPSEKETIKDIAKKLAKENAGELNLTNKQWEERLTIQALSNIDEKAAHVLNIQRELLNQDLKSQKSSSYHKYQIKNYYKSLDIAQKEIKAEADKNILISWKDRSVLYAYGAMVYKFKTANEQQYKDSYLFTIPTNYILAGANKDKREYGYVRPYYQNDHILKTYNIYGYGYDIPLEYSLEIFNFGENGINQGLNSVDPYTKLLTDAVKPESGKVPSTGNNQTNEFVTRGLIELTIATCIPDLKGCAADFVFSKAAEELDDGQDNDNPLSLSKISLVKSPLPLVRNIASQALSAEKAALVSRETAALAGIRIKQLQRTRIAEISYQFNVVKDPKNMTLTINGKTYRTNQATSKGAPVFQGLSDNEIFTIYKELAGITQLPQARATKALDLNGNPRKLWVLQPTSGPLKGNSINLRTGSSSAKTSNTKFTIDIAIKNNNGFNRRLSNLKSGTNVEIKFEN